MNIFQAIILAIIEGITEFLPVSSTAHMIFVSSLFNIHEDEFVKMFEYVLPYAIIHHLSTDCNMFHEMVVQ